jgi:cyclophilin family peptidyl-prolyl cis-trans isomerase
MDVRIEAATALSVIGIADDWLTAAAAGDPEVAVRAAARAALAKLGLPLPPSPPPSGFRLHGHDARGVRAAADALRGARLVLETTRGTIVIRLYPDEAPAHCVNVAALAGDGFYDGLTWHRVVADFVIQGGCPRGDGAGNGGVVLPDEIGQRPYVRGTVGMPKGIDDTGGCQIFITHLPTPHLDGRYTVFGQVVEGFAAVDAIRIGDRILKARVELGPE